MGQSGGQRAIPAGAMPQGALGDLAPNGREWVAAADAALELLEASRSFSLSVRQTEEGVAVHLQDCFFLYANLSFAVGVRTSGPVFG